MILVDTVIWADHFARPDERLLRLLERGKVVCHPFVVGELALGNLQHRAQIIEMLKDLPGAEIAFDDEVMDAIERDRLYGAGIGYVDAHLLLSARLTPDVRLWTRDRRLRTCAERLGVAVDEARLS